MAAESDQDILPWYRQFWPWFIISIPLLTVVAGITTLVIAVDARDPLVVDDYYKEGLGINRVIEAQLNAARMGLEAEAQFLPSSGELTVSITGNMRDTGNIELLMIHATRQNLDRVLKPYLVDKHTIHFNLKGIEPGRWNSILQSTDKSWRLDAGLVLPATQWFYRPDV